VSDVVQAISTYRVPNVQVDDNLVNRRVASLMLSQYGASICCVPSGPEAISTLKKQEQKVDLVLMDIQMPGVC
jgi:CheY-like chemotaxis protein